MVLESFKIAITYLSVRNIIWYDSD